MRAQSEPATAAIEQSSAHADTAATPSSTCLEPEDFLLTGL
ncbi:MAG: hypothetical protein QOJ19_951 [Acidimicrobiia bacterium]|jgi:hypothetical protein|nr:hypothetical protein [Acidimicrobiia bacterium]